MAKTSPYKRLENTWAYLFILPPILQFLIFLVIPLAMSLWLSFHQWDMLSAPQIIGTQNYSDLLNDSKFWKSLYNTFYLMVGIPLGMVCGLILAMLMNRPVRGIGFIRAIYYIPAICSIVAAAQMWMWIFNADHGLINNMLWSCFRIQGPYWFGDANFTKIPMIIMGIWGGMGTQMLFYLAGLQNIPSSLYESAAMDGANWWQKFRYITLPKLTPTTFFILVTGIIGSLQGMAQSYIMTTNVGGGATGGPEYSAATIVFYLWESAFRYNQMGYASAIAWVTGILVFILTVINFRLSDRWVNYE